MVNNEGIAGYITKKFINSHLTLIFIIASIFIGISAVTITPKEEEPQILVPMIDISSFVNGLDENEIENKVTKIIEKSLWGQESVEYIYSSSQRNKSLVTVRFKVGTNLEESLVKTYHKMMVLKNELPKNINGPLVKSYSIDDVPFLVVTLSSKTLSDFELRQKAAQLKEELSSTPYINDINLIGGLKRAIRIITDPIKMEKKGISLISVANTIKSNNIKAYSGNNWSNSEVFDIEVGGRLKNIDDIKNLAIGQRGGQVVYIKDIAEVIDGPEQRTIASLISSKNKEPKPAVSLAFTKKKGTNIVTLSENILNRIKAIENDKEIEVNIVRNYGKTAKDKSDELIHHLILATISVSLLIALIMGVREAFVVAIAIPVTLALTLAIYYFLGYTLNRVTLFALIFSIGILVDDAIVVVENIERHLKFNKNNILNATINAVIEVGNPTILATFTVISAILPMAFVKGLMGPYMEPIPTGASFAMIISLITAFTVTPWAAIRILNKDPKRCGKINKKDSVFTKFKKFICCKLDGCAKKKGLEVKNETSRLDLIYHLVMDKLLERKLYMIKFFLLVFILLIMSFSLLYTTKLKVKMLPFDNKEEFQVLIDYPTTTSLNQNIKWSKELSEILLKNQYVKDVQFYSGVAGPFSFLGLVKHTFLRNNEYMSDFQVVLTDKTKRKISSHDLIAILRKDIANFARDKNAISKVLEIPPGPPVMATMVSEIYGKDEETRSKVANEIYNIFKAEKSFVDLDISTRALRPYKTYDYDTILGGEMGISSNDIASLSSLLFSESKLCLLDDKNALEDIAISLSVKNDYRSSNKPFDKLTIPSQSAGVVAVNSVIDEPYINTSHTLMRKNLIPVVYVTNELSGNEEAPVYGILSVIDKIKYKTQTVSAPFDNLEPIIKWDGEWFMTYEVFRDLGIAFAVVMILIYVLIVGWFKSFTVPFVIMLPIPISLIGILPGHVLVGVYFTATSMIGFIAGAGIIVRNSIILVDFIEHQITNGLDLKNAVISAGVIRFRPMLLTAAAVVVGSMVMLKDPILQGLAVSLIFGEIAATILSRFAVPVLYYYFIGEKRYKLLHKVI